MRYTALLLLLCMGLSLTAQEKVDGPADPKAQKTYQEALGFLKQRNPAAALDSFKKADKQDGGHCPVCQRQMIKYAVQLREWKIAEAAADELVAAAHGEKETAIARYQLALVLRQEALDKKKDEFFTRAHEELSKALAVYANFPDAIYADGFVLARLQQDEAAKAQFERFVKMKPADDPDRQRALLYIARPELARARMAPPFAITTLDGRQVSLDELKGKVVLLDFWATWCAPCREALPHIKKIAQDFAGQPLVVLSVSLDKDQQKWKDFVAKNGMGWMQYCDGNFPGPVSGLFGVEAIPHTFTIDADGVLQDEHIGDASVEGKLKKLVARARELETAKNPQAPKTGNAINPPQP